MNKEAFLIREALGNCLPLSEHDADPLHEDLLDDADIDDIIFTFCTYSAQTNTDMPQMEYSDQELGLGDPEDDGIDYEAILEQLREVVCG